MPNWCRNKIIVGTEEKMSVLVKAHCPIDKESQAPEMDFNTIDPMPEGLDIEYGTRSYDGLTLYVAKKDPSCAFYGDRTDKMPRFDFRSLVNLLSKHGRYADYECLTEERLALLREKYKGEGAFEKLEKLGGQIVSNLKKHGAANWFEWSVQHWGTKWNATDTDVSGTEMTFDTAWEPAIPALVKMSALHPGMPMALLFADEETGAGTGFVLMNGGHIDQSGGFPDFSVDAYKLAFIVWGNGDEYHYDEEKRTYVRNRLEGGEYE